MKCVICSIELSSTNAYKKLGRPEGKFQSYCRKCFSSYSMERWKEKKVKAIEYLGGKCVDCGIFFPPEIYDFHHLDPSTKEFQWNKLRLRSWDSIKKELDKCALLCSNCHRWRHKSQAIE